MAAARSSAKGNGHTQRESIDYAVFKITLSDEQLEQLADKVAACLAVQLPAAQRRRLEDDTVFNSREAADYLKLPSVNALHKLTATGALRSEDRGIKGARLRIRKSWCDDWLEGVD